MAGGGGSPTKKVEAETTNNSSSDTLLPPKFVSVFALCERCNKRIYGNQHNCSFDANLETEAKKKLVEKKKRPPTAFYIFMDDFEETFESENPYINLKNVAKLGGETWKSFTDDEKKVYRDKAAKLMEEYNKSLESNDAADDDVEEDEEKQADEAEENGVENKEDAPNGGQNGRGRGRGIGRRRGILCRGVRGRRSAFG